MDADRAGAGVTPANPERAIAVAHAPAAVRAGFATLLALDERLASTVARAREPTIGLIRLTWWRDSLVRLDEAPPPGEPLLQGVAALRGAGVAGHELAAMTAGWEALLDDPELSEETRRAFARARGATLFRLAGRVLGCAIARLEPAGEGWALADLARWRPAEAAMLLESARPPLAQVGAEAWPLRLRPLGMLVALSREDVRRGAEALRPTGSRGRIARMLLHRWTGR